MNIKTTHQGLRGFQLKSAQSLNQKIACIVLDTGRNSHLIELLLLSLEYIQLISQALLLYPSLYNNLNDTALNYQFSKGIVYLAKFVNPSYLLTYSDGQDSTQRTLGVIICWLLLKYSLYFYVIWALSRGKEVHTLLVRAFRWIFQIQARIAYYFISSFFICSILANKENGFTFFGMGKIVDYIVCLVIVIWEFLFSASPMIQFHYVLPTKSLLSSKDNFTESITLSQKFIIQIFQIMLPYDAKGSQWTLTALNLVFTLFRTFYFFSTLPLYKIKGLLFQGSLLATVSALHVANFLQQVIKTSELFDADIVFVLGTWIILSILLIKSCSGYLTKILVYLAVSQREQSLSAALLIHKLEIIKHTAKHGNKPAILTEKSDFFYLLNLAISADIKTKLSLDSEEFALQKKNNPLLLKYLEDLSNQHPHSIIIKLYLALYYAKKDKLYAKAITLIDECQKSGRPQEALSAFFLLNLIENKIKAEYKANTQHLDLHTFVQNTEDFEQIKSHMLNQTDLQIKISQELMSSAPDLRKIFFRAQSVDSEKRLIEKKVTHFINETSDSFMSPFLTFAYYELIVNHSQGDCIKMYQRYHFLSQKYYRYFKSNHLCQQNIFQDNTAFFVLSGHKSDIGKITYCNKAVKKVCGGDIKFYMNAKIYQTISPTSLLQFYENFFKDIAETGKCLLENQVTKHFIFNKEGYIKEVDFYMNTHPSVTQGYFLTISLRSILTQREFIIVRENGEIEGASKNVCKRLGIFNTNAGPSYKKFHISKISKEITKINEALNMISGTRENNVEVNQAQKLINLFTEKGGQVKLTPVHEIKAFTTWGDFENFYEYHCKLSLQHYGPVTLRVFDLHEHFIQDDNQSYDIIKLHEEGEEEEEDNFDENIIKENIVVESTERTFLTRGGTEPRIIPPVLPTSQKTSPTIPRSPLPLISNFQKEKLVGSLIKLQLQQQQKSPSKVDISTHNDRDEAESTSVYTKRRKNAKLKVDDQPSPPNKSPKKQRPFRRSFLLNNKENSVAQTSLSKTSSTIHIAESFRAALRTNQASKFFHPSCIVFSILVLLTLLSLSYLFINLDNITDNIQQKKEVMVNAQKKSLYMSVAQTSLRTMHDLYAGTLAVAELGMIAKPGSAYIPINLGYIEPLLEANSQILSSSSLVDEASRNVLFDRDVTIYYPNDTSDNLTSFQATDTMIQTLLQVINSYIETSSVDATLWNFTTINLLNDLPVKNDEIAQVTLDAGYAQIRNIQSFIRKYDVLVFVLLASLYFIVNFIIWSQYHRSKHNLIKLTNLSQRGVQSTLDNLQKFEKSLQEEENLSEPQFTTLLEAFRASPLTAMTKDRIREFALKTPNYQGINKRYQLYTLKATIPLVILSLIFVLDMSFAVKSTDYFNTKLYQMSTITHLNTICARALSASIELPIGNDTTLITNMKTSEAVQSFIKEIASYREEIMVSFLNEDILSIPSAKTILFGNACDIMPSTEMSYCTTFHRKGYNTSFVQLLGVFEETILERYLDYENSDKSAVSLHQNRILNLDTILSLRRLMGTELLTILDILLDNLEKESANFDRNRKVTFSVNCISFIICVGVLWIFIMDPLKQKDNKFKRLLQIFPAELVLANFSLKLFLVETSSIPLNFLKSRH